jgi:hypothetical protein
VAAVNERPGITRTQLYRQIGRSVGANALVAALARVRAAGAATYYQEETKGRPVERWHPAGLESPVGIMVKKANKPPPATDGEPSGTAGQGDPAPSCTSCTSCPEPSAPPPVWDPAELKPGNFSV